VPFLSFQFCNFFKLSHPGHALAHTHVLLSWPKQTCTLQKSMDHFRDDSSTASLIHKSAITIAEDDATTVHDGMRQTISDVQMARCGVLEHCECGSISCQSREMYILTIFPSCYCYLIANSMTSDNCQLPRRPYTSPGLWHIIGPQCTSALSSRASAFFSISSRPLQLYQAESCPSSQRHNLTRRSSPR
jgi:hypothetical protein